MTQAKEKVLLTREQETLLIPLYSKATESRRRNPIFVDPKAEEILAGVDYDFKRLRVPRKTSILMCLRAARLDADARDFLALHPDGVVLHLGCGLDSRCLRVDNGQVRWYDLDLPAVIELRYRFFPEHERYHLIASSVTDSDWLSCVVAQGRAVLIIAEGLLMYLHEDEVKSLVANLHGAFPGCRLACDVFSRFNAGAANTHPSIKRTGAVISWGIDDPREMESWAPGIRYRGDWLFMQAKEIAHMSAAFRAGALLARLLPAANLAHRIVYFDL